MKIFTALSSTDAKTWSFVTSVCTISFNYKFCVSIETFVVISYDHVRPCAQFVNANTLIRLFLARVQVLQNSSDTFMFPSHAFVPLSWPQCRPPHWGKHTRPGVTCIVLPWHSICLMSGQPKMHYFPSLPFLVAGSKHLLRKSFVVIDGVGAILSQVVKATRNRIPVKKRRRRSMTRSSLAPDDL